MPGLHCCDSGWAMCLSCSGAPAEAQFLFVLWCIDPFRPPPEYTPLRPALPKPACAMDLGVMLAHAQQHETRTLCSTQLSWLNKPLKVLSCCPSFRDYLARSKSSGHAVYSDIKKKSPPAFFCITVGFCCHWRTYILRCICSKTEWTWSSRAFGTRSKRIRIKERFMCGNPFH